MIQVQRFVNSVNTDSFFPSTIGYIASGIVTQNHGEPHFNDRSFLNVLEWNLLWKVMDDYNNRLGNAAPDENDPEINSLLEHYRTLFENLRESYYYRFFRKAINAIAFIDSNVGRCDLLRLSRNEGSDRERSYWRFYTPLQNLMYTTLYPDAHIDMAWFDDLDTFADPDTTQEGISAWLVSLLQYLVERNQGRLAVPCVNYKLPRLKHDLNLSNITTHEYRSLGRFECRNLMAGKLEGVDVSPYMYNCTPKYLDVYGGGGEVSSPYLDLTKVSRPTQQRPLLPASAVDVRSAYKRVRVDVDGGSDSDDEPVAAPIAVANLAVSFSDAFDENDDNDRCHLNVG